MKEVEFSKFFYKKTSNYTKIMQGNIFLLNSKFVLLLRKIAFSAKKKCCKKYLLIFFGSNCILIVFILLAKVITFHIRILII